MRYIGALEVVWRSLEFDVLGRQSTAVSLPVHLPNNDIFIFVDGKKEALGKNCNSKLELYEVSEDFTY